VARFVIRQSFSADIGLHYSVGRTARLRLRSGGHSNKELPQKFWEGKGKGIWILQKFCSGIFLFVFRQLRI
jgi:hypothetical protein